MSSIFTFLGRKLKKEVEERDIKTVVHLVRKWNWNGKLSNINSDNNSNGKNVCTFPSMYGRHTRPHLKKKPGVRRSRPPGPQTNLNLRKKASVRCLEIVQPCVRLEIKMESAKGMKKQRRDA